MTQKTLSYTHYLSPRYWHIWLLMFLAGGIAVLPLRIQHALGSLLGTLAFHTLKRRREVTLVNLKACFPELSATQGLALAKRSFQSNGIGLVEALRSWFRKPESLQAKVEIRGTEHIDAALAQGNGVILLGAHYSTLDIAGSLASLVIDLDVMQRAHSNGLFNAFMTRSRKRLYGRVIDKHAIRPFIRGLKDNRVTWYATDQDCGRRATVFAPFFGVTCSNQTSTMRLAKKTNAAIVPFSHYRLPDAQGYVLEFGTPLVDFPSGDMFADASRLNGLIEEGIKRQPEQYLWMHRRFKTPETPNTKNIYGQVR